MAHVSDITGERFGKLVAISRHGYLNGSSVWTCQCDCGNLRNVRLNNLRSGNTTTCGCVPASGKSNGNFRHGHSTGYRKTKEYRAWKAIKDRCLNKGCKSWPHYGGRGITICEEWAGDFSAFLSHIGNAPSRSHSVGRINNELGYAPGNVQWETSLEQARNTRRKSPWAAEGETLTQTCERLGISYKTVTHRIWRGVRGDAIFEKPAPRNQHRQQ